MDRDERHELKENDLAEFLSNFGEWWDKYGNVVLLVLVLAAASFAGYRLYNYWTHESVQVAFGELAASETVHGYATVAEEHRHPTVRTLAYLRGGEQALAEAMQTRTIQSWRDEDEAPRMSRDEALAEAQRLFRRANDVARHDAFRANALLGLARVAESLGEWEQAEQHYQQAEQLATAGRLPSLAQQARQGQAMLEQIRQPVVFAPASAAPELPGAGAGEFDLFGEGGLFDADDLDESELEAVDVDELDFGDFGDPDADADADFDAEPDVEFDADAEPTPNVEPDPTSPE